jgi:transcriptional regulator with XRE-family HTH domain
MDVIYQMTNIYDRITIIYNESGLSQNEFAEKANISASYVSKIVHGKLSIEQPIKMKQLAKKVSSAFNINFNWLMSGEGQKYLKRHAVERGSILAGCDPRADKLVEQVRYICTHGDEDDIEKIYGRIGMVYDNITGRGRGDSGDIDRGRLPEGEKKESAA